MEAMFAGRTLRLTAAAFAALLAGGELFAGMHEAIVQHVICEEHGETIHLAATGGSPSAASSSDELASGTGSPATASAEDEHVHCSVVASRPSLAPSASGHALALLDGFELPRAVSLDLVPAVPLLRLAPKTSPPNA